MKNGDSVSIRVANKVIRGKIVNPECRASHGPNKGKVIPGLSSMLASDGSRYWVTMENRV